LPHRRFARTESIPFEIPLVLLPEILVEEPGWPRVKLHLAQGSGTTSTLSEAIFTREEERGRAELSSAPQTTTGSESRIIKPSISRL
jgi:hypothetical protein